MSHPSQLEPVEQRVDKGQKGRAARGAEQFPVTPAMVYRIKTDRVWRHA